MRICGWAAKKLGRITLNVLSRGHYKIVSKVDYFRKKQKDSKNQKTKIQELELLNADGVKLVVDGNQSPNKRQRSNRRYDYDDNNYDYSNYDYSNYK